MGGTMRGVTKRGFLKGAGALAVAGGAAGSALRAGAAQAQPIAGAQALPDMTADAQPITPEERLARIAKAQKLMAAQDMAAVLLDAGSALDYFTGIRWGRSERYTGVILPREGEITVITPAFEEPTIRERMTFGDDVRVWQENENPFALVPGVLNDRGLNGGRIGIEETVRYFIADGVRQAAPDFEVVSGAAVTRGCRMFKSVAELALMQRANDVTLAAYRHIYPQIEAGMTNREVSALMSDTTRALGGQVAFSICLIGEASAYPHGTDRPQMVEEGAMILMDCGASVHGYKSDISRSWVFGDPTEKQRQVWNTVKAGQELALETAQVGVPAGKVDATVRAFYEREGFGPGYKTPGLSHRLGHGIGMDGHEPINFVQGEDTPLAPGMCFSNEPGIYIFGEFGVRLEDCLYMTAAGPQLFSPFSKSIDDPMG